MKQSYEVTEGLKVVCVITGTGPLKEHYEQLVEEMKLQHVWIKTM